MIKKLFDMLTERGFVKDLTHSEQIKSILNSNEKITFYLGIDPTADSLHIGHFFALRMFRHLQNAGHKGILLIGGATALVGDPTGKTDMRKMLEKAEVERNINEVKTLAKRFVLPETEIVNNADWINKFTYVDFMRLVCIHFNVNTMLASDAYKQRRENGGLTFLEMGYMPMQAYDFVHLNEAHGCRLQIGGSDQWGNIVAGTELYRKMNVGKDTENIFGFTVPLLMTADGKKMGKTEKGTMWVARDKTTPYDFYQYFYNVPDENTAMLLKLFTDIPVADIDMIVKDDIVAAKKQMAFEITKLVHGASEATAAAETAGSLFSGGADMDAVPSVQLAMMGDVNVVDFVVAAKMFPSKSEARRTIEQGGLIIDGRKIIDASEVIQPSGTMLLQKGKKTFLKVVVL